jgi:hypothetical protein
MQKDTAFSLFCVVSNLPFQPPSPLPYIVLRLHVRSLGYQRLRSGGVSKRTCQYQRRRVVLNQPHCEGEVGQLGLDSVEHFTMLDRHGRAR